MVSRREWSAAMLSTPAAGVGGALCVGDGVPDR
jgi:hypothetical protein